MTGGVLQSRQVKNSVKEKSSGHDLFILEGSFVSKDSTNKILRQ